MGALGVRELRPRPERARDEPAPRRVLCCTSAGVLDTSSGFPTNQPIPCTAASAVTAIVLPKLGLAGSLASGVWHAFSNSLVVLDMGGALRRAAALPPAVLGMQGPERAVHVQ